MIYAVPVTFPQPRGRVDQVDDSLVGLDEAEVEHQADVTRQAQRGPRLHLALARAPRDTEVVDRMRRGDDGLRVRFGQHAEQVPPDLL